MGLLFIGMITLVGCKKEQYQPKGDYVVKGQNNNNVQSAIYTINTWNGSNTYWWRDLDASDLNLTGVVMVYRKNGTSYESLSTANANNYNESIGFDYDTYTKVIGIVHASISGAAIPNPGTETYKVVTIPTSGMATNPNIDLSNYEEVSKAFDLK